MDSDNCIIDVIPRGKIYECIPDAMIKVKLTVPGDPVSKQRPRFVLRKGGGVYTPKQTKEAEEIIKWEIKKAHRELLVDEDQQFAVYLGFFTASYQRRDVDNMSKLVFDACTGIVWKDDCQVKEMHSYVERQDPNPRTEIIIWATGLAHRTLKKCRACKKLYYRYPADRRVMRYCSSTCESISEKNGVDSRCLSCKVEIKRPIYVADDRSGFYCSRECKHNHSLKTLTCEKCGKEFTRHNSLAKKRGRKFCSEKCHADFYRDRRATSAIGVCSLCGASTTKKEYRTCRACFISKNPPRFRGKFGGVVDKNERVVVEIG
jgi:Holliday junction resolvase RusA-like endonuclease